MLGEVQTSVSCISRLVPSTRVEDGQEDGAIDMNVQSNQIIKFGFVP